MRDQFWSRYKQEYLQSLQPRSKLNERQRDLEVGGIVIMKEETPRNEWHLAQVIEAIMTESDGEVRKAKIIMEKDGKRTCLRPTSELIYLISTTFWQGV